ncbi:ATP-binding protein [Vibrio aestuarianus]|uniref:AAA family ATPase n=1 Tax=Vibrio aestuarianus TaxID=28171 RepID=UPI00237C8CCA|nr:AAA family ATPase [Vibrio aestuarianus]MDE1350696.1 ATP-binding protein [Vibrio aestuarianus]
MKLVRFEAQAVHDYLDFNVDFRPDVNFFAGLNGSGKTTALKMIMAMLTPSLEALRDIEFSISRLVIEDKNKIITIAYQKSEDGLLISLDGYGSEYVSEIIPWDFLESPKPRHIWDREQSKILRNISKISTPIFLSLDRRFIKSSLDDEFIPSIKYFNDEVRYLRHEIHHSAAKKIKTGDVSIDEVVAMIHEASLRAKNVQSRADKKLRDNIILDSLTFSEADVRTQFPTRNTLRDLQSKQMMIRKTLDNLDVSNNALEKRFDAFFFKLENIINKIERFADIDKSAFEREIVDEDFQEAMSEWVINQNQLKRIDRLFDLVQKYQIEKRGIYKDLNRLEGLVNKFLNETGKSIHINQLGQIKIRIGSADRNLSVLSSGERQILIMFVHLVLDKKLQGGIFIIDEPELSLHISWQDMFVDAVLEANPNLQLVLATHSPSIIGGRNHMYVPLNGGH